MIVLQIVGLGIAILGLFIYVIIPLCGFLYNRSRKLNAFYEVMWKKSSSLEPNEIVGLRAKLKHGYSDYYYKREVDKIIKEKIEQNKNVLIIGNPLAGKSRAIYQTLKKGSYNVIIPKAADINNIENFKIPMCFKFSTKKILVLDDIDKFSEKNNFKYLLDEFSKRNILIIASCRTGQEYEKAKNKIGDDFLYIFKDTLEISIIPQEEREMVKNEIITKANLKAPFLFDGNIGSIFLGIEEMKNRFRNCSDIEREIFKSLRVLYYAGIYMGREVFSIERIKKVCQEKVGVTLKPCPIRLSNELSHS